LAAGEVRITLPRELASHSKIVLALLLEASFALSSNAFTLSEAAIASLLAPSGASVLASRLRAFNALDLGEAVVASS